MGEALITRRGGTVKRGKIANVSAYEMSDPALIGVKNAVIAIGNNIIRSFARGKHDTQMLVAFISIENGAIASYFVVYGTTVTGGWITNNPNSSWGTLSFDIALGKITADVHTFEGDDGGTNPISVMGVYNYIIFD